MSSSSAISNAKGRLRSITGSVTIAVSVNNRNDTEAGVFIAHDVLTPPAVYGFEIDTTIELQYYIDNALAGEGLGAAASTGEAEIYASVYIEKIG